MKSNLKINSKKESYYIDSNSDFAVLEFTNSLYTILNQKENQKKEIILLCIGTDKATGDSLGPLVGYKLSKLPLPKNIKIYGTLENPVHAKNLKDTINNIYEKHLNSTIIAVDASLGSKEYINYINIGNGSIQPGAGIKKTLPYVGDIFITGIVNSVGILEISVLQNTRLAFVMKMADIIASGLWHCLNI